MRTIVRVVVGGLALFGAAVLAAVLHAMATDPDRAERRRGRDAW
jgi:hypothetical protein